MPFLLTKFRGTYALYHGEVCRIQLTDNRQLQIRRSYSDSQPGSGTHLSRDVTAPRSANNATILPQQGGIQW